MGGVYGLDYAALPALFDIYGVPAGERANYLDKIGQLVKIALRHWNADKEKS